MENFFNNFKYEDENLFRNYHDNYIKELQDLIYESNKSDEILCKETLNSFEIIAVKTGESIQKLNFDYKTQKDIELVYCLIVNTLNQCINRETFKQEDISQLNRIFTLISKQPKLSLFKVKFYTSLLKNSIEEKLLNYYDTDSLSELIKSMKIDLKLYEIIKEKTENSLYNHLDGIHSSWRFTVENFFSFFPNEVIIKNIHLVQEYYEFCLTCCFKHEYDPYTFIAGKILRMITYYEEEPKHSLYFDLPKISNNKDNFEKLVDLYKSILLSDLQFNEDSICDFGIQIRLIFVHNDTKNGFKIFLENNIYLYNTIFEIFLQTTRSESLYVLSKLRIPLNDVTSKLKSKFKDAKNFNLFLITKLSECARHFRQNWNFYDQKKDYYVNIETFIDFFFDPVGYIISEIKERSLAKSCLILIIDMLEVSNLKNDKDVIGYVKDILNKEKFYLFSEMSQETMKILNMMFNMAIQIELNPNFNIDDSKDRKYFDNLNSFFSIFSERFKQSNNNRNDLFRLINEYLFEKLIFEPLENDYGSNEYFKLLSHLIDLFSFEFFPTNYLNKLKQTYQKMISSEIFDTVGCDTYYSINNRIIHFNTIFKNLACSLPDRKDIRYELTNEFIQVISSCIERKNFKDPFNKDIYTNYFNIADDLSKNIIKCESIDENLVDQCAKFWFAVWFDLYENNDFDHLSDSFTSFLYNACKNYTKVMANKAETLWEIYFRMKNENLAVSITEILPYSIDVFMDRFSTKLADFVFLTENYQMPIMKNYSIFFKLTELAPDFFFQSLPNREIHIMEIFNMTKTSATELNLAVSFIFNINFNLLKNGLSEIYQKILFENRRKYFRLLFNEGEEKISDRTPFLIPNYSSLTLIQTVCEIYKYLGTVIKEKSQVKCLIDDLIELIEELKSKEVSTILSTIEVIGKSNKNNLAILKDYHLYFTNMKKDKSLIEFSEFESCLISLVNFIEEKDITKLADQVLQNTTSIMNLETSTQNQELKIKNINQNLNEIDEKIGDIEETVDEQEKKIELIDNKTLFNLPLWCKDISKVIVQKYDWILVSKRLNFNENDIKGWLNQVDPFLSMLQEWFVINKTSDAIKGLLKMFKELNYVECVQIIENNLEKIENDTQFNDDLLDDELIKKPPQVFICYEWSSKSKAILLKKYLVDDFKNNIRIWFDDGNMGGGDRRNNRIDVGLRSCYVMVCLISKEIINDKTCVNQINLAVQLNKYIIPLLIDNSLKWPPQGSLGPIMSEYLFIRFFQRPKEVTGDERYWPIEKFNELLMQIKQLVPLSTSLNLDSKTKPEIFISYQWDKQKDIINLYNILTNMGLSVWLDINQMAGGDSLYEKIDSGLRNCDVVISCVTTKYGLSANCRKEIALADSLSKPIIPILLEKDMKYPPPGPMAPTLSLIKYIDFTNKFDENNMLSWNGDCFNELLERMKVYLKPNTIEKVTSKACIIS